MSTEVRKTGYVPRPIQYELHQKVRRFSVLVIHRRFGKTVWAVNHIQARGMTNPRKNPQYAYIAPLRDQAKRVAWDYAKQYASVFPGVEINEAELRIDIPRPQLGDRVRIMLLGADNPDSLRGIYLDGAVLDEYAQMDTTAWGEVIRPALSDRMGWAVFLGTPKGRNHFWELYDWASRCEDPEWFAVILKASQTGVISEKELASAKRDMRDDDRYEQEYECSFQAGVTGAYFSKEISAAEKEGRITVVPVDPTIPIDTWWDLGMNDVTAIWFVQRVGRAWHIVDYDQESDLSIPDWHERIRRKEYKNCYFAGLPHDAAARELQTGRSREEAFRSLGWRTEIIPRQHKADSIHAVRAIMPLCYFDKNRCEKGLKALMNYQRKFDHKLMSYSDSPLHNWASNGADAFQQFAIGAKREGAVDFNTLPQQAEADWDVFSHAH